MGRCAAIIEVAVVFASTISLTTGLLNPQIVGISILRCDITRGIPKLWDCSSGKALIFLQDHVFG